MTKNTDPKNLSAEQPRVPAGVAGGQWDKVRQGEVKDGSLTRTSSRLTKMTPVAVDTELAAHIKEIAPLKRELWAKVDFLEEALEYQEHMANHPTSTRYRYNSWKFDKLDEQMEAAYRKRDELNEQIQAYVTEHIDPIEAEWERRGRWSRFFLVTSSNGGHVHSSRSCSTCFPRTQFVWLVDEANKTEEEIVERAGDGACTVCFPSAPVADKANPRPNPFEDPDVKAARAQRAEEKRVRDADKAAKGITNPDGSELRSAGRYGSVFKTERAAEIDALDGIATSGWFNDDHSSGADWEETAVRVQIALLHKRGADQLDAIRTSWESKLNAKAKRDKMPENLAKLAHGVLARVNARVDEILKSTDR